MNIAVTSASGQLGAAIIHQLIKELGPAKLTGIARTPENAAHLGINIRKANYNNRQDFENALAGMDAVILLSGNAAPEARIPRRRGQ